jgi:hypothetical protein
VGVIGGMGVRPTENTATPSSTEHPQPRTAPTTWILTGQGAPHLCLLNLEVQIVKGEGQPLVGHAPSAQRTPEQHNKLAWKEWAWARTHGPSSASQQTQHPRSRTRPWVPPGPRTQEAAAAPCACARPGQAPRPIWRHESLRPPPALPLGLHLAHRAIGVGGGGECGFGLGKWARLGETMT